MTKNNAAQHPHVRKKEHICSILQKMPSSQSAALIISFNHILISVNQHKSSRTKAVGAAVLHSSPLSHYRIPLKHCCTIRKDKQHQQGHSTVIRLIGLKITSTVIKITYWIQYGH